MLHLLAAVDAWNLWCRGRAVPSWFPCYFSCWLMAENFKMAQMLLMLGLTLMILFEQVKALPRLRRMTEVWVLASALLLCVEGPDS